jgi:RNA polymerase sigma-70 factor (family 1)
LDLNSVSAYNERDLFLQVAGGDVTAFRTIFDAYRLRLYGAAFKLTKSDYAAEEIVQEIFTALWESRANLANVENPPAYIFTIAYNKTFRYLKKASNDQAFLQSLTRKGEGHSETEEYLDVRESEALINDAVKDLPPQRKLIYKMSREKGMSHAEIAEELNISPLTVKRQIQLALHSIRETLAKTAPLLALFFLH